MSIYWIYFPQEGRIPRLAAVEAVVILDEEVAVVVLFLLCQCYAALVCTIYIYYAAT